MVKQDFLTRSTRQMIRVILKIAFRIDTEDPNEDILQEADMRRKLRRLTTLADEGKIDDAENEVYDLLEDGSQEDLKTAILFYSHLNAKTEEFLEEHDFSREEVKMGLETVASKCGVAGIADIF